MPGRRKGRELAVQMLYQWDINRQPVDELFESFGQLGEHPPAAAEFARRLVRGALANLEEIDSLLSDQTEKWRLSRMAAVDRNVLRMAVYELLREDTPRKVVINEALEVTRKFSTPEAVQFVNGILDGVRLRIEAAGEAE